MGLLGGEELVLWRLRLLSMEGDACTVILCWKSAEGNMHKWKSLKRQVCLNVHQKANVVPLTHRIQTYHHALLIFHSTQVINTLFFLFSISKLSNAQRSKNRYNGPL